MTLKFSLSTVPVQVRSIGILEYKIIYGINSTVGKTFNHIGTWNSQTEMHSIVTARGTKNCIFSFHHACLVCLATVRRSDHR